MWLLPLRGFALFVVSRCPYGFPQRFGPGCVVMFWCVLRLVILARALPIVEGGQNKSKDATRMQVSSSEDKGSRKLHPQVNLLISGFKLPD